MTGFISRQERFDAVGSTNDVVRTWLAEGTPEVCLAVADEQTAGRGRAGRSWVAPAGRALLLSLGFRPSWLAADRTWRLAAITALAMADAAEEVAGLADGAIRLKWPNDLVVDDADLAPGAESRGAVRKLAGLLGETDGLGTADPRAVIGLGINADWPASEFPADLAPAMTSLREASHGRPIDLALLLDAFLGRVEARVEALRGGRFDVADWQSRQLTTGRIVRLERPDGSETVKAIGVDVSTGALIVEDETALGGERAVIVGEVTHVRLEAPAGAGV
jgi:BirA family transcriptional regulator, biotin operon repressor / biotin---[acetyl-CoA-carboxylase] ligase